MFSEILNLIIKKENIIKDIVAFKKIDNKGFNSKYIWLIK